MMMNGPSSSSSSFCRCDLTGPIGFCARLVVSLGLMLMLVASEFRMDDVRAFSHAGFFSVPLFDAHLVRHCRNQNRLISSQRVRLELQ